MLYYPVTVAIYPEKEYRGNWAAVMPLKEALSDTKLADMATRIGAPATSFFWLEKGEYVVRWFAPDAEIQLCGHGALATFAYAHQAGLKLERLRYSKGLISGGADQSHSRMDLDAIEIVRDLEIPDELRDCIGLPIAHFYETGNKHLVILEDGAGLQQMRPDFERLAKLPYFGYIVTAPSDTAGVDFISRTLVPKVQELEDSATGSSHTVLTTYYAKALGKNHLIGEQLSPRGGRFACTYAAAEQRVSLEVQYRIDDPLSL